MVDLERVHQHLVLEIREGMAIVASGSPVSEIGATFEQLSRYFQALGICHLLRFADREEFCENLCRSGHSRLYYLRKSQEQGNVADHRLAISRTEAFLNAAAAGDLLLARTIADLSPFEWRSDGEYEDDFCYYSFLHDLLRPPIDLIRLGSTLRRFEAALEGADPHRLQLCRALLTRERSAFLEAFEELMGAIAAENDEKRRVVEDYQLTFWPRSFISVEGLALLRAAEQCGIVIDREFDLCPAIGRLALRRSGVADLFEEIDRLNAS